MDVLTQGLANEAPSDHVHHKLVWGVLIMDALYVMRWFGPIFASVWSVNPQLEPSLHFPESKRLQEAFSSSTLLRARHPSSRPWVALNKILTALSHPSTTTDYPFTQGGVWGCYYHASYPRGGAQISLGQRGTAKLDKNICIECSCKCSS